MTRRTKLARWEQLSEFITFLVWSGHVQNGRPQSIIMVAEPGEGKTELLERFRPNPQLAYYSDITYRPVIAELNQAAQGKRTHLVVTELQKVINRRKSIAESTLTIMLQAMEEGVHRVAYGPRTIDLHGAKLGLLAATTVTSMRRNPFIISELAMDSRAYVVDARGSRDEILEIERRIATGDTSALKPFVFDLPDKPVPVKVAAGLATKVRDWIREMEERRIRVYGVRTYTRFLRTLQGVALSNGRTRVTKADLDQLYTFKNLWLEPPSMPPAEDEGDA